MSEKTEKRRRKVIKGMRQKFGETIANRSDRTIKRDMKTVERTGDRRSVTAVENGKKRQIKIRMTNTGLTFPSIKAAAKHLNLSESSISKVVRGKMRETRGYMFEKVEE